MTTEAFIIQRFCLVDDHMDLHHKHRQARLWPSELVTIGLLFALKGGYFRAFYRWLKRDYEVLFVQLPHRTRLQRLLATHQDWCDLFLADPTFFTVIDSYGIELIHPTREGRRPRQVGKKGKSNWRWIVGMKPCWLVMIAAKLSAGVGTRPMSTTRFYCPWWPPWKTKPLSWLTGVSIVGWHPR